MVLKFAQLRINKVEKFSNIDTSQDHYTVVSQNRGTPQKVSLIFGKPPFMDPCTPLCFFKRTGTVGESRNSCQGCFQVVSCQACTVLLFRVIASLK